MRIKLGYSGTFIIIMLMAAGTYALWSWVDLRLEKDGWKIFNGHVYKVTDSIQFGPSLDGELTYVVPGESKHITPKDWYDNSPEIIDVDSERARIMLDAELDKKRLIMEADGALNEKLETYQLIQELTAKAMRDFNTDVPAIYLNGD